MSRPRSRGAWQRRDRGEARRRRPGRTRLPRGARASRRAKVGDRSSARRTRSDPRSRVPADRRPRPRREPPRRQRRAGSPHRGWRRPTPRHLHPRPRRRGDSSFPSRKPASTRTTRQTTQPPGRPVADVAKSEPSLRSWAARRGRDGAPRVRPRASPPVQKSWRLPPSMSMAPDVSRACVACTAA